MGCCHSTPASSFDYPAEGGTSSSQRAITASQPQLNPSRPSASSHSNRPHGRSHQPLSAHINQPLKPHVWTSKRKIWTRADIDREREAYFDTRVTGNPQIWSVIRMALEILWAGGEETDTDGGFANAQGILTAVDVTIPTGDLAGGVYDSSGQFYPLPEYVVSDPTNLSVDTPPVTDEDDKIDAEATAEATEEEIRRRDEKGKGVAITLKARLSDGGGEDYVVKVGKDEPVRLITRRIFDAAGLSPPASIRIAYRGGFLKPHLSLLEQEWQEGHVVNAMVFHPPQEES